MINFLAEAIILSFIIGCMIGAVVTFHLQSSKWLAAKAQNTSSKP